MSASTPDHQVLVVGAGFSGIGVGIGLDRVGLSDWLILEAGDEPGGTWYWNSYPGIAVDIPTFSYQFSFEQSTEWSRTYAPGRELKRYADHCVAKYGLRDRIRFRTRVTEAVFDETANLWRVHLDDGTAVTARFLINASGVLTVPKLPDIDGVEDFAGITMHTARWDHDLDLTGKRVAIIGTGASAIQIIPEIAPVVGHLEVFQRTPIWCLPKFDVRLPPVARRAMRLPGVRSLYRALSQTYVEFTFPISAQYATWFPLARIAAVIGRAYLAREVRDPVTRDALTPRYAVGCKRPGFHNTYLSTYNRNDVDLVTDPIAKVTGSGVATADGTTHEVDVLILATGFKVLDVDALTFEVTGTGGQRLADFWERHRMQAYEGVSVPGFPNFFNVMGPYGYVGSSYFALIEAQTHHIVRCLLRAEEDAASRVEVSQEANDRFFAEMMSRRHRQVFWQDSCRLANSYYFDRNGDVPLRPGTTVETYLRSRRFPLEDYQFGA
ncbi:flavin-containing monooxygenase [Mycolicibacterium grossiae]|uniref:Monooxygenase n=1 Tax=Mycolicibacterium grossiae TaxID=1552759 RepID=A0A1E8PW20_9MYCO|nr:NAD(P)/FAD-dependent oxidoreductase [Mycolicibacterium grossiae]OFJ50522.1 monooxygenase [Mycolicibacterium grossiae]QEM46438.1 NAD(P)/FAD-dependent oxidoreductase [Mycolicibacterium grossiae]